MIEENYIIKENIDLRKHLNSRSETIDGNKLYNTDKSNLKKEELTGKQKSFIVHI